MLSLNQSVAPPVSSGDPAEPVTIEQAKEHCEADGDSRNSLFERYIAAARAEVEHLSGRQLLTATWVFKFDSFPGTDTVLLPVSPLQSITSVAYIDINGSSQTLATSVYDVDTASSIPRIFLKDAQSWPSTQSIINAVTVTLSAGYGDAVNDVPECARSAILMLVGTLYRNRETVITGTRFDEMKGVLEALLDPISVWEVA